MNGLVLWMMPSLEPSFRFLKSGVHSSESGGTTAKPWFCDVTNALLLSRLRTGWLCPRLPKGMRAMSPPAARPRTWLPMQMPKVGLPCSSALRRILTVSVQHSRGSPGPFETNRPSKSIEL